MSVFQALFVEVSTITATRYSGATAALAALQVEMGELPHGITPLLKQDVIPSNELIIFATKRKQLEGELSQIATRHSQLGWMIDPAKAGVVRALIKTAQAEYEQAKEAFVLKYPVLCESVLQEFRNNLDGHPASNQIIHAVKEMQPSLDYVQKGINFSVFEITFESVGEQAKAIIEGLRGRAIADITRWSCEGLSAKSPAASYKKVCAIQSKLESLGYYISAFGDLAKTFKPIFELMSEDPSTSYSDTKLTETDRFEMRKHSAYLKSFNAGNELHDYIEGYADTLHYTSPDYVAQASLLDTVSEVNEPLQPLASGFVGW